MIGVPLIRTLEYLVPRGSLIAMLFAYMDESGTDSRSAAVTVGACVSRVDQWSRFVGPWQRRLKSAGIPYFHAAKLASKPLYGPLVKAIREHSMFSVAVRIDKKIYRAAVGEQFMSFYGGEYPIAAIAAQFYITNWAIEQNLGDVTYVIETGQPAWEHVAKIFSVMMNPKAHPLFRVERVIPGTKEKDPPLATADLIAHEASASYGKRKTLWLGRLERNGLVVHDLAGEQIERYSVEYARFRGIKRAARKRRIVKPERG